MARGAEFLKERAEELKVEFERHPSDKVVVTGFSQITPLGNTRETWDGLLKGESGVVKMDIGNERTNIGAPLQKFKPEEHFTKGELNELSRIQQIGIVCGKEASAMAKLTKDNKFVGGIDKDRVAIWVASGIGSAQRLIDIYRNLKEKDSRGGKISPHEWSRVLPEQLPARIGVEIGGCSGWGGSTSEACATGASNIVEGCRLIKNGLADIVIAGGFEEALYAYPEVGIGIFSSMKVTSARNAEPEKASRPYDEDRDGLVVGSGGALVVLESIESALKRKVIPYAVVTGFEKSMDGAKDLTKLDPKRVAKTILQSLYDQRTKQFRTVDAIFAHETSTKVGDKVAAQALYEVFGDELKTIPVTAIKSMLGHLLGGAGAVNIVNAIYALQEGKVPKILNLETPDPEITMEAGEMYYVRNKTLEKKLDRILATAMGFGGFNTVVVVERWETS